jgi:hypothetical protein
MDDAIPDCVSPAILEHFRFPNLIFSKKPNYIFLTSMCAGIESSFLVLRIFLGF